VERTLSRPRQRRYGGYIDYSALALRLKAGYATANTGLGTGVSGCSSQYCGSAGNMGNPPAIAYGDPPYPTLGLFGHPERIKDFGYRAIHLMTVRGREITTAFYQQSAKKSYFISCSTGGKNALMEAQRFPHDYDGIVAGASAFNHTRLWASGAQAWRLLHDHPANFIVTGQMTLVNKAVLKRKLQPLGSVNH
jgi:feruloyl esterase